MIITKKDIGKTVYLVPTGNNVANYQGAGDVWSQVVEAQITEMARTRGKMMLKKGHEYETSFTVCDYNKHQISNGLNCGYRVFSSLQEVKDHKTASKTATYLLRNAQDISDENLVKIAEILELDFD